MEEGTDTAWDDHTRDAAMRWRMQADELCLPSEVQKSYQAMMALRGRDKWWEKALSKGTSKVTAARKLDLLKTSHLQSMHLGGRDAIIAALKEALDGELWPHAEQDAAWVVLRCEHCRRHTIRGRRGTYNMGLLNCCHIHVIGVRWLGALGHPPITPSPIHRQHVERQWASTQ
jgi:hypothetical protein